MKRAIFNLILILFGVTCQSVFCYSQNVQVPVDREQNTKTTFDTVTINTLYVETIHADNLVADSRTTRSFSNNSDQKESEKIPFKKILDKEFSRVTTGKSTNYGSYASYDVKDNTAVFAGHIRLCEKSNLQFEAKGVVNEGILPIAHAGNVSPNFSAKVQFNDRIYEDGITLINDATKSLNYLYSVDSLNNAKKKKIFELGLAEQKLSLEKKQKDEQLNQLQTKLAQVTKLEKDSKRREIKKDSLDLKIAELNFQIHQLDNRIEKFKDRNEFARQKQNIEEETYEAKQKLRDKLRLTNYSFKWWSYYGGISQKAFYSFRDSLELSEQLLKQRFTSFEFGARYNYYTIPEETLNPRFYSVGFSCISYDNFSDLTEQTLTDKQEYSTSPFNRSISSTQKVYVGNYEKGLVRFKIDGDMYLFVTNKPAVAIHLNPNIMWNVNRDMRCNLILGCLVSFRNQEDSKSVVNAELFFQSHDLSLSTDLGDLSFINNSGIGLRFTFPIVISKKLKS